MVIIPKKRHKGVTVQMWIPHIHLDIWSTNKISYADGLCGEFYCGVWSVGNFITTAEIEPKNQYRFKPKQRITR